MPLTLHRRPGSVARDHHSRLEEDLRAREEPPTRHVRRVNKSNNNCASIFGMSETPISYAASWCRCSTPTRRCASSAARATATSSSSRSPPRSRSWWRGSSTAASRPRAPASSPRGPWTSCRHEYLFKINYVLINYDL